MFIIFGKEKHNGNMKIGIIVDSGSDITQEEAKQMGIAVLPLKTYFGTEEFLDGVTMSHQEFYERLIETNIFPSTSQISPYDYELAFENMLKNVDHVLCFTISSKLSGCYQSACIAAKTFEGKITVIDTENVAIGERLLIQLAMTKMEEITDMTEAAFLSLVSALNRAKHDIRVIALLDTLEYLRKGGRIPTAVAIAGGMLSIKPVVAVVDGAVAFLGQARGSKAGNNKLNEMILSEGGIDFNMPCAFAYTGLSDQLLQKYLEDNKSLYEGKLSQPAIYPIGCVIGTHLGPGGIAAAFFTQEH